MRRTLPILLALALVTAGSARARSPAAALPRGIHAVAATLSFPAVPIYRARHTLHRTFTSGVAVRRLVALVDALEPISTHIVCPAIVFLGPELTLVFRAGPAGPALAETQVQVTTGSRGHSGQSPCFPIRIEVEGHALTPRVSATFVRAVGRLMGVAIS